MNKLSKTAIGIAIAQTINFLCIPILARMYSPANFALFGFYLALVGIFSAVATGKYHDAISTCKSDSGTRVLMQISFKFLVLIALLLLMPVFAYFYYSFNSGFVGLLCVGSIVAVATSNIALQFLMRQKRYAAYSFQIFLTNGLPPLMQIFFFSIGSFGLILGSFSAYLLSTMVALFTLRKKFSGFSLTLDRRERLYLRKFSSFPLFALPNLLFTLIRSRLLYFILPSASSMTYLGLYTQADRILSAPTSLFAIALRPVATEALIGKSPIEMEKTLEKFLKLQWYYLTPFLAAAIVFSREILLIILGPKWVDVASIFQIIAVPAFLMMTTTWLDRFFDFQAAHRRVFSIELGFVLGGFVILKTMATSINHPNYLIWAYAGILIAYYIFWIFNLIRVVNGSIKRFVIIAIISITIFVISFSVFVLYRDYILNIMGSGTHGN